MKALSLRQPWAHIVLHYGKNLENRRWNTSFRGTFLLHAAKAMTRAEYEDAEDFTAYTLAWGLGARAVFGADFRARDIRGALVGTARLASVIPPCVTMRDPPSLFREECGHDWHIPEQYAFVLEDVVAWAEPIPYKGELGFFEVPDSVVGKGTP